MVVYNPQTAILGVEANVSDKLISITECAERRGITRAAVHAAIKRGDLHAQKIGNTFAVKEADCDSYMPTPPKERGAKGAAKRWGKEGSK
jgi:predicted DNA-binding transcriptional regulator AlpA